MSLASTPHPLSEQTFEDPAQQSRRIPFPSISEPASLDLSVIVPAYNEAVRLPSMLDEALGYLNARAARPQSPRFTYELIVVDDGSTDRTADVALSYVCEQSSARMRLLRMQTNYGKGAAVRQGVLSCRGRFVLMADADGATVFSELENLESEIAREEIEVAIGSRHHLKGRGSKHGRGGVSGLNDTQCGFKLYTRQAAKVAFSGQMLKRWAFDVENLYRVQRSGMNVVEVAVSWTEVPGSKLNVVRATVNMLIDMCRMRYRYWSASWRVALGPETGGGRIESST